MFIQIQTGKLLPLGLIDITTVEWQELPKTLNEDLLVSVSFNERSLFLPDLTLPRRYILTGLYYSNCHTFFEKHIYIF